MGAELLTGFDCPRCGEHHPVLPLSFSCKAPHQAGTIAPWQLAERVVITRDQCVLDRRHFYLRGRIPIAIADFAEPYIWGVWVQVSAQDFFRAHERWNTPGREEEPPFAGRLANALPLFGPTLGLAVEVQTRAVGLRPHLTVTSAAHPLGREQRDGITLRRAAEIAARLLHPVRHKAQIVNARPGMHSCGSPDLPPSNSLQQKGRALHANLPPVFGTSRSGAMILLLLLTLRMSAQAPPTPAQASSMPAQAPPQGGPPRLVLRALDTDQDGQLSAAEIQGAPKALLTLDHNGDGQISADEVQARPEGAGANPDEMVRQLMLFDKDGDGVLTREELPARLQPMIERGDTNHDGRLTADEIRAMAARQGMPAGTPSQRREGPMRNDPLLQALDTDHDGVLSPAEIAAAPQALLVLDKNQDGTISADEMRPRQQTPAERVNHLVGEWDTNGDGRLSKAEAPDRLQQQFSAIDTNQDGFLDRDELLRFFGTPTPAPNPAARENGKAHP